MVTHEQRMQKKKAVIDHQIAVRPGRTRRAADQHRQRQGQIERRFRRRRPRPRPRPQGRRRAVRQGPLGYRRGSLLPHPAQCYVWHVGGEGFTWETQDKERDAAAARHAWAIAGEHLSNPGNRPGRTRRNDLRLQVRLARPRCRHRQAARPAASCSTSSSQAAAPRKPLRAAADTVSDIGNEKHAFQAGIKAMPGLGVVSRGQFHT